MRSHHGVAEDPLRYVKTLTETDGTREFVVVVPPGPVRAVMVVFHPFGFTPESVLDGEAAGERLIRPLGGVVDPALAAGFAVVAARSRGRALPGVSLAWQPHLESARRCAEEVAAELGVSRICTGGLSMGGLEALVFAGLNPELVSAAWAANPIVDLAAWYDDIVGGAANRGLGNAHELIAEEVGGLPSVIPEQYARRSAISYADALSRLKVRLIWSPEDDVIPRQSDIHTHRLATRLRQLGGDVDEQIVTFAPTDETADRGRFAHEACDVWSHVGWLVDNMPH